MSEPTTALERHDRVVAQLDGGSLGCARLLALVRDRAAELAPGTVLHVVTENPIAPIDLPAWCRMTGHEWLGPVDETTRPTFAIRVAPEPVPTHDTNPWKRA